MTTKVKVKCISKKENIYSASVPPVINTTIELSVPYDPKSIYYQMSGGTGFSLNTVNKEAADMFELGKDYDVLISPSENPEVV